MNRLINYRLSIITPKAQTTRNLIKGIVTKEHLQMVLLDTPGIFDAKKNLEKAMVRAAWSSISGADIIVYLHDSTTKLDEQSLNIIAKAQRTGNPFAIVFNKVDKSKMTIEELQALLHKHEIPSDYQLLTSAANGKGIDELEQIFEKVAPVREWFYDEDEITTLPMKFLASEITREELFLQLGNELPYSLLVDTESWTKNPDGSATVNQVVITAREAHKKMIIGKGGLKIKNIGVRAREKMHKFLDMQIHLKLFVKVRPDWENNRHYMPK